MRIGRKRTRPYVVRVGGHGLLRGLPQLSVALSKLRREALAQSEDVVQHQDLAITARTRTNANGWNSQALRDLRGEIERHTLEHDGEGPRLLHGERIVDDTITLTGPLA